MNILIIGGTRFVGRALVERLIQEKHNVTLFNRGKSGKDIFPDIENIIGDRDTDIQNIGNRNFDVVIDTCAYLPQQIEKAADFLKYRSGMYVFISTISVYKDPLNYNTDENAEKCILDNDINPEELTIKDIDYTNYGALKYLCEQNLEKIMPGKNLIIRPGMIIGPYDGTERFSRWSKSFINNSSILAPGTSELPIQFIDVYDLADFTITLIKKHKTGTFNAIGPEKSATFGEIFSILKKESQSDSEVYWASEEFLKENDLWENFSINFPFFTTEKEKDQYTVSNRKSLENGMILSSNKEVMKRIIRYLRQTDDLTIKSGLDIETEEKLIKKIKEKIR